MADYNKFCFEQPLGKGDLIGVSYASHVELGIFIGYGSGTVQYYVVTPQMASWIKSNPDYTPRKAYAGGSSYKRRVVRLDENTLIQEYKEAYTEIKKLIK